MYVMYDLLAVGFIGGVVGAGVVVTILMYLAWLEM